MPVRHGAFLLCVNRRSLMPIFSAPSGSLNRDLRAIAAPSPSLAFSQMQYVSPPIHTFCLGQAASMGSLLLSAGAPGHRYSLPNASVMIHQPSGGASGQATDISIHAKEILRIREVLTEMYASHCAVEGESTEAAKSRFGE